MVELCGYSGKLSVYMEIIDKINHLSLCLNRRPDDVITGEDAFALYEANWRFIEEDRLQPRERDMIARLTQIYGHGLMNV